MFQTNLCVGLKARVFATLFASAAVALPAMADCTAPEILCVGPGEEYDTNAETNVELVLQAAADDAVAGDTIRLRGGLYQHNAATSATDYFLTISNSGTAQDPIVMEPFEGEEVIFEGFGFPEGTEGPARRNERLLRITGDYVQVRGLDIRNSSRYGMVISGSYGLYEDLKVHDSWESNMLVLGDRPVTGNHIRHVEIYRSRHGTGIWVVPSSSTPNIIADTVIEYSLAYDNGYQPDGLKVPSVPRDSAGGGNSDGIGIFKGCHEKRDLFNVDSLCPNTIVRGNVLWHNADDGLDTSAGAGSLVADNISFSNQPEGNRAYKLYASVVGGLSFVGNIAMNQPSFAVELRFVEDASVYNNSSVHNNGKGYALIIYDPQPATARFYNNLSAYNINNDDWRLTIGGTGDVDEQATYSMRKEGDPLLNDPDFDGDAVDFTFAAGATIEEKVTQLREQILTALAPSIQSPLIDAGVIAPGVHCAYSDDDPASAGNTPGCRHWSGQAPDIGAVEFTTAPPAPPAFLTVQQISN